MTGHPGLLILKRSRPRCCNGLGTNPATRHGTKGRRVFRSCWSWLQARSSVWTGTRGGAECC